MVEFSKWQIDRIRQRLEARYEFASRRAPKKTWEDIAFDIIACKATALDFMENEPELWPRQKIDTHDPIKVETLRRYVDGIKKKNGELHFQVPKPNKLAAIRDYLIFEGFLGLHELEEHRAPYYEACVLAEAFGSNNFSDHDPPLPLLTGEYLCEENHESEALQRILTIHSSPDLQFLRIREIRYEYHRRDAEPLSHLLDRVQRCEYDERLTLEGWAVCTGAGLLISLRSESGQEAQTRAYILKSTEKEGANITALRLRGDAPEVLEFKSCRDMKVGVKARRIALKKRP